MNRKAAHRVLRDLAPHCLTIGQITKLTKAKYDTVGSWTEMPDFPPVAIAISDYRGLGMRAWLDVEVLEWLENDDRSWARREAAVVWRSKLANGEVKVFGSILTT